MASGSRASVSFTLVSLSLAAGIALPLGPVGISGVVSYVVSLRTREIGLHIAVGADPAEVRRMVPKSGIFLAGTGVSAGLVASTGLTRLLGSLLVGVRPVDPVTFLSGAVGLTLVVLMASWIPANRASQVNPIAALRNDRGSRQGVASPSSLSSTGRGLPSSQPPIIERSSERRDPDRGSCVTSAGLLGVLLWSCLTGRESVNRSR